MYQTHKTYIKGDMSMADLLLENPALLLFLEHFGIDFAVQDKTVDHICREQALPAHLFLTLANIYNGFQPHQGEIGDTRDITLILRFLKSSHDYYKNDKYLEIKGYIAELQRRSDSREMLLLEEFFMEYFTEVLEHLRYEDEVAFPYFQSLTEPSARTGDAQFSVSEYREHHTDIESALADLKQLLFRHVSVKGALPLRRRLLIALLELEFDLHVHSLIEDSILLPLVELAEQQVAGE
jgi:regulator of cell morphogenesis and NO signaling